MGIGLYIHIPFCIKKCNYCDFVSLPYDADLSASYVYALEKEMEDKSKGLTDEQLEVTSVYFGGGTPTCLSAGQLIRSLESCRKYFRMMEDAEITFECNPGTVDCGKLALLRKAGFNRVSIGVQAGQEKLLRRLGRIHNWMDVVKVSEDCRKAGFANLSFDLMFGIPGQTLEDWRETLKLVMELKPSHISAYNLKYEEGTSMYRDLTAGRISPCDEDEEVEMYLYAIDFLAEKGLFQYEISNFARPGMTSKHNLLYWQQGEYLGLGAAAHSMLNNSRFSNVESVELYIDNMFNGHFTASEVEVLGLEDQISEALFLGLRLNEGIDIESFTCQYGVSLKEKFASQLKKLIKSGLLEIQENRLKLTRKGLPLANEVFVEFI